MTKYEVLKKTKWSKADAFLLPLTGLNRDLRFSLHSYLFWKDNSIEDYKLTIAFTYDNKEEFLQYLKKEVFPVLDKKGYLIENYDVGDRCIFVLDMSEWAMDIEMFLAGRYSQMTQGTKTIIEKYHYFNTNHIEIYIYAALYPKKELDELRDGAIKMTPIQYMAKSYGFDLQVLEEIGEVGSKYDKLDETLLTDVDDFCQPVIKDEQV